MNDIPASTPTEESISSSTSTVARWGFWGTCLWGLLIGVVFVVLQTVTILVGAFVRSPNGFSPSEPGFEDLIAAAAENGTLVSIATLITAVVCCGLIAGVVKLKKGATVGEYLSLGGVEGRTWLNWLGATAVLVVLSDLTTTALGRPVVPEFMTALYATAQPVWLLWLALVVGAPLFEETFFRGFLLAGLKASALRPAGAVVATSVLWSLMHLQYDAYGILTVFAMGLLFGMARIRTGSLLVPMGLHAAVNLTATIQAATLG